MADQMNDDGPIDFSALGPALAADRLDALVAAAVLRGADDLDRRRGVTAVVRVVVAWRRPLLALSGLAAAAAIAVLVRPVRTTSSDGATAGTVAEALGIPAAYAASVEGRALDAATGGTTKP